MTRVELAKVVLTMCANMRSLPTVRIDGDVDLSWL